MMKRTARALIGRLERVFDLAPTAQPVPREAVAEGKDIGRYAEVFDGIKPWAGEMPLGYRVDFLGNLTDLSFEGRWGFDPYQSAGYRQVPVPILGDSPDQNGEFWFEAADWVLAAREAKGSYVMATLGACFGYQAVGAYRAVQLLNPMPCKLIAVDPIPENTEWTKRHFRDNGIDADEQWIVTTALSDNNEPVFFPVGAPGLGVQNCISSNGGNARVSYVNELIKSGRSSEALRNLLLTNSTGLTKELAADENSRAEIKLVSALTLADILGPFDRVDYIEADMQESEINVFPACVDLLKRKVRRIHIGTHGIDTHLSLHKMFAAKGWEIVFSFEPESTHETVLGTFKTNDGVLTVRNPDL
jgi:hypothetical protein